MYLYKRKTSVSVVTLLHKVVYSSQKLQKRIIC